MASLRDWMPIKFRLNPIFEAILKVEERILVRYVSNLRHKGIEVVNVITNTYSFAQANVGSLLPLSRHCLGLSAFIVLA